MKNRLVIDYRAPIFMRPPNIEIVLEWAPLLETRIVDLTRMMGPYIDRSAPILETGPPF